MGKFKCLVNGCENYSNQSQMIGDLCAPCHHMLTKGKIISPGNTFIHKMREEIESYENEWDADRRRDD